LRETGASKKKVKGFTCSPRFFVIGKFLMRKIPNSFKANVISMDYFKIFTILPLLILLASASSSQAETLRWSNPQGGLWHTAANWDPPQVPKSTDDVEIRGVGGAVVTVNASAQANSILIGGMGDEISLRHASGVLAVGGSISTTGGGSFVLAGGSLEGPNVTLAGTTEWEGGYLGDGDSHITVAEGGVLNVRGGSSASRYVAGVVTNRGTIRLLGPRVYLYGVGGKLVNAEEGLVDAQVDSEIVWSSRSGRMVENHGVLRKSGGTGTTRIGSGVTLMNHGVVETLAGRLQVGGGGRASGSFVASADTTLEFTGDYTLGETGTLAGAGTNRISSGSFTVEGMGVLSNAWVAARIRGTNVTLAGTTEWEGGYLGDDDSHITVAEGGVLNVRGGASNNRYVAGVVTNRGTIRLLVPRVYLYGVGGKLVNAEEGLVDAQVDSEIVWSSRSGRVVENHGVLRKSGGTGTTRIGSGVTLMNHGVVETLAGRLEVGGGGRASGSFVASANTTLEFDGDYTLGETGIFAGAGTNRISGGTFTVEGMGVLSNAWVAATIRGANVTLAGVTEWEGGHLGDGRSHITVAEGGVLNVRGGSSDSRHVGGAVTNRGTIRLLVPRLYLYHVGGKLVNAEEGLLDAQVDSEIVWSAISGRVVENHGVLRKSGGTGTTRIGSGVTLMNHGVVETLAGRLQVGGGGSASGSFVASANTTLEFAGDYTMRETGTFAGAGTNRISSGTFTVEGTGVLSNAWVAATIRGTNVTLAGVTEWEGGYLGDGQSHITVAEGGVLNVRGGSSDNRYVGGVVTNRGTISLLVPRVYLYHVGGKLVNAEEGLLDVQVDTDILWSARSGRVVENHGVLRKSGGTGTTTIGSGVTLQNHGVLEVLSGKFRVSGSYTQSQSTLRFGLRGSEDYGAIALSGGGFISETISVILLDDYRPVVGSSFRVVDHGSREAQFAFDLGGEHAWHASQADGELTLSVLNARPDLPATPDLEVPEESPIALNLQAADIDQGQETSVELRGAPAGAVFNQATGAFLWTPAESQGPGVYGLSLVATDNGQPPLARINHFQIEVLEVNQPPTLPSVGPRELDEMTPLVVDVAGADSDLPANPLSYKLGGAPANAVLSPSGILTWTPTEAQGPSTNTFTVALMDDSPDAINGRNLGVTNTLQVVVREVNQLPVITELADRRANAGETIHVAVEAQDADLPAQPLSVRLGAAPQGATLDPEGGFSWSVGVGQADTTNVVQIIADDGTPQGEAVSEFTVVVDPLPEFILTTTGSGAEGLGLTMNALPGLDYVLQSTPDFSSWLDLATNTPAGSAVEFTAPANPDPVQVYRVRVLP